MIRRTSLISLVVLVALLFAPAPAPAYQAVDRYPVGLGARIARGCEEMTVVWASEVGGVSTLTAERCALGGTAQTRDLVSGISDLQGWAACGHGAVVTVAWKAGGAVYAQSIDMAGGGTIYGPVNVCTDAAVAAAPGDATGAALSDLAPDGAGGAWVWCTVTPTTGLSGIGDSLVNHLSPAGEPAVVGGLGLVVAKGTIKDLDSDSSGSAYALLGAPGRNGVAMQRFAVSASNQITTWKAPVSPYLLGPPTATAQEPLDLAAAPNLLVAWREGAKVKVQRYSPTGGQGWLTPPAVVMAGLVKLAGDWAGGVWLAGPSADGLTTRHILGSGRESAASPTAQTGLGLATPLVTAVTSNRAGDFFVCSTDGGVSSPGISLVTATGAWESAVPSDDLPWSYTDATPDGAGGAWAVGCDGSGGYLYHVANGGAVDGAGAELTFRPVSPVVNFGSSLTVKGYLNSGRGVPLAAVRVGLRRGDTATGAPVETRANGYFSSSIAPRSNGWWSATAHVDGVGGVTSRPVKIAVRPRITLAPSHIVSGRTLTEILTGAIKPAHPGKRVRIQKATPSGWRTVASGRVDGRSRYRVAWRLPYRTATYKLRALLPEHADHAQGFSATVSLRVVVKRR